MSKFISSIAIALVGLIYLLSGDLGTGLVLSGIALVSVRVEGIWQLLLLRGGKL